MLLKLSQTQEFHRAIDLNILREILKVGVQFE